MKKHYRLNIQQFLFFITTAAILIWFAVLCVDIFRNPAMYLTTYIN